MAMEACSKVILDNCCIAVLWYFSASEARLFDWALVTKFLNAS